MDFLTGTEVQDKEQQILQQCCVLMFKLGIKSLTMEDFARELGISKKTLYQVVDNKADLVRKLVENVINFNCQSINQICHENTNPIDEILKIYQFNSKIFASINPSLTYELQKYYPESWQQLNKFKTEYIYKSVCENLETGIKAGLYREDINIAILARLYSMRVIEITNIEFFPPELFSQREVLREMFLYHMLGIVSAKGLKYLKKLEIGF